MKKYISRKMKNQRKTMIPGVFSSTMYQMTMENIMANSVPPTRARKPNMDCPLVMVMPIAYIHICQRSTQSFWMELLTIMIIAHTSLCSMKNVCVSFKNATMPLRTS